MREASQNNTNASVASANVRTVALELSRSIPSSTSGPTSNPTATKTIAGVTGVPDSRLEIAATPSSVSATMASDHSIQSPRGLEIARAARVSVSFGYSWFAAASERSAEADAEG